MSEEKSRIQSRRNNIRKLMRQGIGEEEIAIRFGIDISLVYDDIEYIKAENAQKILSNKSLLDKDVEAHLNALHNISEVDEEAWKVYYDAKESSTKLLALEKIRQNTLDRAKILKILNPMQVHVDKLVYIEKLVPILVDKIVNLVIEYIPKEKQIEVLEKIKTIDIEREIK